jgi:hypothetical protein
LGLKRGWRSFEFLFYYYVVFFFFGTLDLDLLDIPSLFVCRGGEVNEMFAFDWAECATVPNASIIPRCMLQMFRIYLRYTTS